MTASDPLKRPLRLPRRSADGPTAQVRNAVSTTLNNNHKAFGRANKREDEECRDVIETPGQFPPAELEQDKELDKLRAILKEPDVEQHDLSAALEMITNAAESEIGPSLCFSDTRGRAAAPQWSGASSPAGVD